MNRTWTDRYEERGLLGASGFGAVYRAWDRVLWREVAIKTLRPDMVADAALRQQFLAEAQALAALRHPNIVDVYDLGESDHGPYFAMELLQGRTLADTLAATGRMEPRRVVRVVRSLADALDHTHAAGIVHGDVKPLNVMIETSGRVVLFDYGIATAIESDAAAGHVVGTPAYMAPEVARGERGGPAADIYALAVLTYQALSGRTPFDGAARDVLQAQIEQTPPALATVAPDLPAALSEVVSQNRTAARERRRLRRRARRRAADRPPARSAGARSAASADATPSGGFTEAFTLRAASTTDAASPAPARCRGAVANGPLSRRRRHRRSLCRGLPVARCSLEQ
ncbi:MAG: serine/threonine-protein kinase [Dehalococcoidia bacterium]